jgi:Sulfite exporter TauE/SafE
MPSAGAPATASVGRCGRWTPKRVAAGKATVWPVFPKLRQRVHMSILVFAFFYLVMFAISAVFSSLGVGGGVLYTPAQLLFGIEFHTAASTSLFLIMVTSLSATLVFRKAATVDWPLAIVLETSTTFGAFLGGLYSGHFSGRFLIYLFSGVTAVAAFFMVKHFEIPNRCGEKPGGFYRWRRGVGPKNTASTSRWHSPSPLSPELSAAWSGSRAVSSRCPCWYCCLECP